MERPVDPEPAKPLADAFQQEKTSLNIPGLRARKGNARRVFPMLSVKVSLQPKVQGVQENSSYLPVRSVQVDKNSARVFIPTPTSVRVGPHRLDNVPPEGVSCKQTVKSGKRKYKSSAGRKRDAERWSSSAEKKKNPNLEDERLLA